jgi:hypothetical protein
MPFGKWKNWKACIAEMDQKYSPESAKKVCGKLQANLEKAKSSLGGVISEHEGWLYRNYTTQQKREFQDAREKARKQEFGKDAQKQDQPHPRLELTYDPKQKSRRSKRVYDAHGFPRNIFKAKFADWKQYVSEEDLKKIPDSIKNRNQGMPTNWHMATGKIKKEDYPKWHTGQFYKGCSLCEGRKVEEEHAKTLEHAGVPKEKVKEVETKIAEDHLKEDPKYYEKLKLVEGVEKADTRQVDADETDEKEIRNLHLNSKLSPSIGDLKEVRELTKDADMDKEWNLDLEAMLKSERTFSGTFHKPVIDKENDIIPAKAMDAAMDDFMILPTLQEVHTERTVGIIVKAWKTGEEEYKFIGKIKPGSDCDDVWDKVKKGIYDGLSIGGRRIRYSNQCHIPSSIRTTPCVTHKLKLYNVSVCSSPVNPEATVDSVSKSEDVVFDLTETLIKAESTESITKGELMADENVEGVSKSDEDLITKSDIAGLTKAVEDLNKSFEHYFNSLTTPHPQHLGGKGHSTENTMHKDEDPDPDEDPKRMKKAEEEEEEFEEKKKIKKSLDIESITKSFNEVIAERDEAIYALQDKVAKMEEQKIQKGGQAVIVPELLEKNDPLITNTNLGLLAGIGRIAK